MLALIYFFLLGYLFAKCKADQAVGRELHKAFRQLAREAAVIHLEVTAGPPPRSLAAQVNWWEQ